MNKDTILKVFIVVAIATALFIFIGQEAYAGKQSDKQHK